MRILMIIAISAISLLASGCGNTDGDPKIDYDNPNLTGGLSYTPDQLVFSDNVNQSFKFTYNSNQMLPTGVDSTSVDSVYDVSFNLGSCMNSVSSGGVCTIDIKFKDAAYVCTDTTSKMITLKFRYQYDFGTGYVKDQRLPIRCVTK